MISISTCVFFMESVQDIKYKTFITPHIKQNELLCFTKYCNI